MKKLEWLAEERGTEEKKIANMVAQLTAMGTSMADMMKQVAAQATHMADMEQHIAAQDTRMANMEQHIQIKEGISRGAGNTWRRSRMIWQRG